MKSIIIKSTIAVAGVFLLLWLLDDSSIESASIPISHTLPEVSVISVEPSEQQSTVNVTGTVKARWQVNLNTNVRGQVVNSLESIMPGSLVKKGDVIAIVDDVEYQAALADAKANESSAKLELSRVLNEQSVAKKIENGGVKNDYRLYKPHVEVARVSLEAARTSVLARQKLLDDTKIKAPFDAIVLAKHIVPAQQLTQGELVYTLASSETSDIEVSLSTNQWEKVALNPNSEVTVYDALNRKYQASLRFLTPHLDSQTKQRSLTLSVERFPDDSENLLPEQQVIIHFNSTTIADAVVTPSTVLTRDNKVWTVANNKLQLETVTLIDEQASTVMFTFTENPQQARQVVLFPLSTMITGQEVSAKSFENDSGVL